jgi:hypothetical protein
VIRSGAAGVAAVAVAACAGAGALGAVISRHWTTAIVLGGLAFAGFALGSWLFVLADPDELKARAERNEKLMAPWLRSVGRASGGWDPRPPSRNKR